MEILQQLALRDTWVQLLQYKTAAQHLNHADQKAFSAFIDSGRFASLSALLQTSDYVPPLPVRREINKSGVSKKRIVYSYPDEFNLMLKGIAWLLYEYDSLFAPCCYAFRRSYGVGDAIRRFRSIRGLSEKYCLKINLHDYFNSIPPVRLLEKLSFLEAVDAPLYRLFGKMLLGTGDAAVESRGAMAGTPTSPFFANVYLMELDWDFYKKGILYFRYSDDILLFADTQEQLQQYQRTLYDRIADCGLSLNPDKVRFCQPGEKWEFLGFCYDAGRIDLSETTIFKMKGKIRRKAHALRKWQQKKGLSGEKAAKGFLTAMNRKFFGTDASRDFTWSRWFFPNLTTDRGLKELDAYVQQYVRYCATGKHSKGNYRITYQTLKEWGYRSLVNEYYKSRQPISPARNTDPFAP